MVGHARVEYVVRLLQLCKLWARSLVRGAVWLPQWSSDLRDRYLLQSCHAVSCVTPTVVVGMCVLNGPVCRAIHIVDAVGMHTTVHMCMPTGMYSSKECVFC